MRYMGLPNVYGCKCLEHNPRLSAFKSESKVSPSQPVLFQGPSGGEEGDGSKPLDIPAASSGSVPARWPAHFSGIAFICLPAEPPVLLLPGSRMYSRYVPLAAGVPDVRGPRYAYL